MTITYNTPAIVIIDNGEDDPRIVGPFHSGDTASNWAFKHLPVGVLWHWLPIELPWLGKAE